MREEKYILSIVAIIAVVAIVSMITIIHTSTKTITEKDNIGYAAHTQYPSFEQPINKFTIDRNNVLFSSSDTQQTLTITTNDTAVYKGAYVSINSLAWQQVNLTGTLLGGNWLTGYTTATITIPKSSTSDGISTDNYIIIYSCTKNLTLNAWDCHEGKWQLLQFNTTKTSSTQTIVYAIHAGGSQYTDTDGTTYAQDNYYTGGSFNPEDFYLTTKTGNALYDSERFGDFQYNFPVTSGNYEVTLKFAEVYATQAGERVFNVDLQGQRVLTNLDLIQAAGFITPYDRAFNITVANGNLNINFTTVTGDAKISAIRIKAVNGTINTNSTNMTKTCTGSSTQSCPITNGAGIQTRTCNITTGNWGIPYGTCTVQSCNNGYVQNANTCITDNTQPVQNLLGKTYYISSSGGNDANNGTSTSSPWKTLNQVNSTTFKPGDQILFKRGDTFYGSLTIVISGNKTAPIIFGAYGTGDKPKITGFTTVTQWNNLGGNIWESTNPVSTLSTMNVVSINGANTAMGRYPNGDAQNKGYLTFQSHSGQTSLTSSSLTGNPDWTGAEVVVHGGRFIIDRSRITQSGNTLTLSTPTAYELGNGFGFFIQNDPRTLDQEGEWYYNPATHKIQVYSTSQPTDVKVASVDNLIEFTGGWSFELDLANVARGNYLIFNDISFSGANSNSFYIWEYWWTKLHDVSIQNCNLSFSGADNIHLQADNLTIENDSISDSNNKAVDIAYSRNAVIRNNTVRNSGVLTGMGLGGTSGIFGAVMLGSSDMLVEYNTIINTGHNAISFGNDAIIRNNYIDTFCTVIDDGAGVYGGKNSLITGNVIVNGVGANEGTDGTFPTIAAGVYCDDNSDGCEISYNSIYNVSGYGIFNNNDIGNMHIHHNTVFDASLAQFRINNKDGMQSYNFSVHDNIFVAKSADQVIGFIASVANNIPLIGTFNNNYYARPINDTNVFQMSQPSEYNPSNWYKTLSQWQAFSGQDMNSHKSPKSITNTNDLRFEYNPTRAAKTITLDVPYIDVKNVTYSGSVTLQPFTSIVLIKK